MMQGLLFLAWSVTSPGVVWYVMRRMYQPAIERATRACVAAQDTVASERDQAQRAEATLAAQITRIRQLDDSLDETRRRAETAEGIARGQAKHIEALQKSNDKMLETITDMRRVGFSLPDDILREASDDRVTTVQDDDREYVSEHPHLAAGDLD